MGGKTMSHLLLKRIERSAKQLVLSTLHSLSRHPALPKYLPIREVRSMLFVRFSHIGDLVTLVPITRALEKRIPGFVSGLWGLPGVMNVLNAEHSIRYKHEHHPVSGKLFDNLREARKINYGSAFPSVFLKTTIGGFISRLAAPNAYTFTGMGEGYKGAFDFVCDVPYGELHATDWLAQVINGVCGEEILRDVDLVPGLSVPEKSFLYAHTTLEKLGIRDQFVFINVSARMPKRTLTPEFLRLLLLELDDQLGIPVVISSEPSHYEEYASVVNRMQLKNRCVFLPSTPDILDVAAVLSRATVAVSPDTAVVHLASAMHTPIVALYQYEDRCTDWYPYKVLCSCILAENDWLVATIPPAMVAREIVLLKEYRVRGKDAFRLSIAPGVRIQQARRYELLLAKSAERSA